MLQLALRAGIPFIHVTTTDLINFPFVLEHLAGDKKVAEYTGKTHEADVYYVLTERSDIDGRLYDTFQEEGKTLVVVNHEISMHLMFEAGEVPVPKEMVLDTLEDLVSKKDRAEIAACFSGLTLKSISEIIRLTQARDKSLTPKGIMTMRATLTGKLQGLSLVDTELPLYLCPKELSDWITLNQKFFLEAPDYRLMPRGLVLDGDPGVGKSSAAKYIANQFQVPLYRLDLSGVLGKWLGQSESMMTRVFSTLDQEAPAVFMVDEVEKLFSTGHDDEGVTARLLSQLLWWMAEHKTRVLTVMTCNDIIKLPKELYRAGRVDRVIKIKSLKTADATVLAVAVLKQFIKKPSTQQLAFVKNEIKLMTKKELVAHAVVDQHVRNVIKYYNWIKVD